MTFTVVHVVPQCRFWHFELFIEYAAVTDMGADGGTIPRRDELVKEKKKPEKVCYTVFSPQLKVNK